MFEPSYNSVHTLLLKVVRKKQSQEAWRGLLEQTRYIYKQCCVLLHLIPAVTDLLARNKQIAQK